MTIPPIKYTKCGNINIAYQVVGSGPIDLVYIPGWVSNIDWMWACPELVGFFKELSTVARIILFDKRGTGLSDRVVEISTMEERMEDIKAVMDAAESEKAILFGHSEGGSVSALFSATYPNRVLALIAFGIFAKRRYSEDYPWAPTDAERQKVYDMIENSWGSGNMNLEAAVPSKANDQQFMSWLASYLRSGASPKAALQLTKMNTDVDITGILEYIKVPTLLMQRSGDSDVKIEEGKFIAERIKESTFIEFEGSDHLFWAGNTDDILSEMIPFIKKVQPKSTYKKGLITLLFGQVSSSSKSNYKIEWISAFLNEYEGRILKIDKEHFVAIFDSPGIATLCGTQLLEELKKNNVSSVMGAYMREGHHHSKNSFCDIDRYMINAMFKQSNINQILITQTIKHLLAGADVDFLKTTSILNFQSDKLYDLYTVESSEIKDGDYSSISLEGSKSETFLEQVHQIINKNFEDNSFGVETLTKEIGMSERQLQRKLKEIIGKSPGQLITLIRLNKAKEGLLRHKYTVAEITFLCGFSCPSYFSKCFKKEFGVSPRDITTS